MHDQLQHYRTCFFQRKDKALSLRDGVEAEFLTTRPDSETWSVAQVFDHLNTAGWLLLRALEDAVQTGQEKGPFGSPPFRYGFISRWFVRLMQPSSRWSFTAPSVYEPDTPERLHPGESVKEFCVLQEQFADCVILAEGLDLRRLRVASPAFQFLRISVGAWFEATLAHEERHLEQAERILQSLDANSPPSDG